MTKNDVAHIIEWMYVNDKTFKSSAEWRNEFVKMIYRLVVFPPLRSTTELPNEPINPGRITKVVEEDA